MIIINLIQMTGLLSLFAYAAIPLYAGYLLLKALIADAKDFENKGLRALYRVMVCFLLLSCLDLALPSVFEFLNLLYYMSV